MRGIIYDPQSFSRREGIDRIIIGRLSKQPDPDNSDDPGSAGAPCRQSGGKAGRIKIEGHGIDLGKDRNGTQNGHDFGAGSEGERRNNDAVSRHQPLGQQRQNQRICS